MATLLLPRAGDGNFCPAPSPDGVIVPWAVPLNETKMKLSYKIIMKNNLRCFHLNPQAAGSVTGARLVRRCRLSSLTTAQAINSAPCVRRLPACETDILVGFSAGAVPQGMSPQKARSGSLRPWRGEFTLCPATLPLPGKAADLGSIASESSP